MLNFTLPMKKSFIKQLIALVCILSLSPAWATLTTPQLDYPGSGDTAIEQSPRLKLQYQSQKYIYEFELADNAAFTNSTLYSSTNYYTYLTAPLAFSKTYYWRARVRNTNDSSSWTTVWSFKTSANLHLMYPSPTDHDWFVGDYFSHSKTTHGYFLYEFDTVNTFNSGEKQVVILPDTASNYYGEYLNSQLLFGKTYYWRGRSFSGTDSSGWSEVRWGITRDSITLSAPNPIYVHPTTVELKYSGGGNVYFIIEVDVSNQFQSSELRRDTVFGIGRIDVEYLKYNTNYFWRVRMLTNRDTSRWSQVWEFKTVKYDGKSMIVYRDPDPEIIVRKPELDFVEYYAFEYDTVNTFDSPRLVQRESVGQDTLRNLHFGDTYYLRFRAIHQKDTSEWCRVRGVSISRYPNTYRPSINKTDIPIHDSLSWDYFVFGVTGFQIQCDTSPAYNSPLALDSVMDAASAIAAKGIIDGNNWLFNQRYYWRVRMWHDEDTSDWSDVLQQKTFTTIAKPNLVKPYNGPLLPPGTDPLFTWDPIPAVPYYRVQLDTNQNLNSAHNIDTLVPASSLGTWYQRYLLFGTRYYWRVKAIETYDSSEWSDTWSFDVRDKVKQTYPKNNAVNYSPGNTLDWASQSGTEGYILRLSEDSTFQTYLEVSDTVKNPFFAYPGPSAYKFSTPYFWKVKVFHAKDTGEWSEIWKFTTRDRIAPTLLSPTNGAAAVSNSEKLTWKSYSGAASYRYELATDSLFTQIIHNQAIANTTSYALSLQPSTRYFWRVIGRNSSGAEFGEFSETWTFTTDSGFKAPTLISPANSSILNIVSTKFTWSGDGGTYVLEVAESPSMVNPTTATTSNEVYTLTSLKFGKNYWWRVRSKNASYSGPWSDIWTFTLQDPNGLETPGQSNRLYPNPSSGSFTIEHCSGFGGLTMLNALGQEIPVRIEEDGESIHVSYGACSPGIYWVNWTDDKGVHREKISVVGPTK